MFPVYDSKVYNGSLEEPYRNPKAPVHITTGSAGCQEYVTPVKSLANFAAFSNNDYGFTYMTVHNATHIHIQQISKNQVCPFLYYFYLDLNSISVLGRQSCR